MNKKQQQRLAKALFGPLVEAYGTNVVQRLMGFHLVWHLFGGEKALLEKGWGRTNIWKSKKQFQHVFGCSVDEAFPEFVVFYEGQR